MIFFIKSNSYSRPSTEYWYRHVST